MFSAIQMMPHQRKEYRDDVIDQRLSDLIKEPDLVNALDNLKPATDGKRRDLLRRLRQLRALKRTGNYVTVTYAFASCAKSGRLYAKGASSQGLMGAVRRYLFHDKMRDFDIVNCYSTIISQLCAKNGISCPRLNSYVTDRESHLERIMAIVGRDRKTVKDLLLTVIFGGSPYLDGNPVQDPWFNKFAAEARVIARALCGKGGPYYSYWQRAHNNHKDNPLYSAVSSLAGDVENAMLPAMEDACKEAGMNADILAFDGTMTTGSCPEDICARMEKAVFERTEFEVTIIEKPMAATTLEDLRNLAKDVDMEPSIDFDPNDEEHVPQGKTTYLPDDVFSSHHKAFLSITASMGQGKTHQMTRSTWVVEQCRGTGKRRILAIVQRKSMKAALTERFTKAGYTVAEYDKLPRGAIARVPADVLICEYESLHRLVIEAGNFYDIVFADEWASICNTMCSETNKNRKSLNYNTLQDICCYADKFVGLDAGMTITPSAIEQLELLSAHRRQQRSAYWADMMTAGGLTSADITAIAEKLKADCARCGVDKFSMKGFVKRKVVFTSKGNAVARMIGKLQAGKRIGVPCGSKSEAEALAKLLEPHCKAGTLGLYTSDTPNKEDLYELDVNWDPHQCIIFTPVMTTGMDYNGEVDSVFMFPCTGALLPRDAYQQTGRFRNVKTHHVYTVVDSMYHDKIISQVLLANTSGMTQELSKAADDEYRRLMGSTAYNAKRYDDIRKRMAPTAHVKDTTFRLGRIPDGLLRATAHANVERSYTTSQLRFLTFFAYICREAGYTLSEDRIVSQCSEDMRERVEDCREALKIEAKEALAAVDVTELAADEISCATVRMIASRLPVKPERMDELTAKYPKIDFSLQSVKQHVIPLLHATREFPKLSREEILEIFPHYQRHKGVLQRWNLLRTKSAGIHRSLDFMKSIAKDDAYGTGGPQIQLEIYHVERLAEAMGLESVFDRTTVVQHQSIDPPTISKIVDQLAVLGVRASKRCKTPYHTAVNVLNASLGIRVSARGATTIDSAVQNLLDASTGFDIDEWFTSRHDEMVPKANTMLPTPTMDDDRLRQLADMAGDVYEDVRKQAQEILDSRKRTMQDDIRDSVKRIRVSA